jgi:chromate transporter
MVERRRWLDDAAYADLVALCQFLPGPASSQVAFALGMKRAGVLGGLVASIAFMLPSAVIMILFAYGVGAGDIRNAGWMHGLQVAAVAVVALAAWGMLGRLCPDWGRRLLAACAAASVLLLPGVGSQVGVIAAAGLVGFLAWRHGAGSAREPAPPLGRRHAWAAAGLVFFALLLVLLPIAARLSGDRPVAVFDSFYRAGALVFGGGHVVLPLLRSEVVPPGWIDDSAFLTGYGAAQAVPGPLFTFAGYLGTMIQSGPHRWVGGVLALLAIFLPGWLLVAGAVPFWHILQSKEWAQGILRGANAAVVGLLASALYRPLGIEAIRDVRDILAALAALALLGPLKVPPWAVVLLMAAAGHWVLR